MKIKNMKEAFELQLEYAYDCEKQLTKALGKMAKASDSVALRSAFEQHLRETEQQAQRLERVFASSAERPIARQTRVIEEAVSHTEKMISSIDDPAVRDAVLIAAGNEVEHYEMALYGTLRNYARLLGNEQAASLLQQTLDEEKQADAKLTEIGETSVNRHAVEHVHA